MDYEAIGNAGAKIINAASRNRLALIAAVVLVVTVGIVGGGWVWLHPSPAAHCGIYLEGGRLDHNGVGITAHGTKVCGEQVQLGHNGQAVKVDW
jgi:hypothetical protein